MNNKHESNIIAVIIFRQYSIGGKNCQSKNDKYFREKDYGGG